MGESIGVEVVIPEREIRRSFALGVFNGAAFRFAQTLIDPPLVLTWFVSQLTSSNLLVGLVAPLGNAGWFLPQIFVSVRLQRMQRKMPIYTLAAVARTASWLLLAATVWLIDDPLLLLIGFFVLYTVARVAGGSAGPILFDVVAKTIPARRRGSFFAWRQFLGGVLGLGAGWIVTMVLNHPTLPFPRGHAFLFVIYCVVIVPALVAFIIIREPPGATIDEPLTLREQLRRAGRLLWEDQVYRRYVAARLSLGLAGIALPFYSVYAKSVLGAPGGMVGVYVATRAGAMLFFDLPWGCVSDRWGNRLATRLLSLGSGLTVLLALTLVGLVGLLRPQGAWLPYLALPLFFLDGATYPAQMLVGSNFLVELVPETEWPLCLGLSNTLLGVVVLSSGLLGGAVVDLFGFTALFLLTLGFCLLAFFWATELPEPREIDS